MTERDRLLELLDEQVERLKVLHRAHWEAAKAYKRYSRSLGLPVVVLTTATGTALFASLESSGGQWQILAGSLALTAAVLAAVQTFLNYSEQAAEHRAAAPRWGVLRRKAQLLLVSPPESVEDLKSDLTNINNEWTEIEESVPGVPPKIYKESEDYYKKKRKKTRSERALG